MPVIFESGIIALQLDLCAFEKTPVSFEVLCEGDAAVCLEHLLCSGYLDAVQLVGCLLPKVPCPLLALFDIFRVVGRVSGQHFEVCVEALFVCHVFREAVVVDPHGAYLL